MPIKQRYVKVVHCVTSAAKNLYKVQGGIEGLIITNAKLAEMLGRSELIAYSDLDGLRVL